MNSKTLVCATVLKIPVEKQVTVPLVRNKAQYLLKYASVIFQWLTIEAFQSKKQSDV